MAGINIVKPGTIPGGGNICIPVGSFILGNLNEVCAADKIVLPKKDRIGTGKTLYSYIKKDDNTIDQDNRAVSYYQAKILGTFYRELEPFDKFIDNIPTKYKEYDPDSPNILIPEKYLYIKEEEASNIPESVISARNLPCALTKVVHSNTKTSDPYNSCNDNTIIQFGDSEVVSKKTAYYIYPQITATPLSGVYDYHPLLINPNTNAKQSWSTTGNSGSVGIYYKLIGQNDQFLVRPSIRYSLELSWADSTKIIDKLYPSGLGSSVFDKIGGAYPLGNSNISLYSGTSYVRYKSKYGSTYSDTLYPEVSDNQYLENLKNIRGVAIYNNYTNIGSDAFNGFGLLKEVLFANSDNLYEEHGLKYGLLRIYDKAFYRATNLSTIKTFFHDADSVSSALPDSVNFLGAAAFYNTALQTLNLCNTQITNIPTDCFFKNKFVKLKIATSSLSDIQGYLSISPNTKLGPAALRSNTNLTTIEGLANNVQSATFFGCTTLNTITTGSSNEITSISDVSFAYCPLTNSSDLLVKVLPKVRNVGMGAFYNSKISGSIGMIVPTCFNKFAFADDNNLGNIDEISFQDGSLLDDFCLYGLKNLKKLTNLIGCNLSSYALDGSRIVAVKDSDYTDINLYTSAKSKDITGNNDLIYTIKGTSGWFYDAFSNDSYGIRNKLLPVGVYLGSESKGGNCIFYKFHPLGGGKSKIHSKLQDYYIHPNTVAIHEITCAPKLISKNDDYLPFVSINTDSDGIFKNAYNSYKVDESKLSVYMFNTVSAELCKGLTKIVDYAFIELDHKSFVFPNNATLTYLGKGAFYKCSNLENVTNLEKLTKLKVILRSTFNGCDLLEINLPNTIETIEEKAFYENSNLSKITFNGALVSTNLTTIKDYAFKGTRLDKTMEGFTLTAINNLISKCTYIGECAFADILSPRDVTAAYTAGTVTIPNCCTYLGLHAFAPVLGATQFTLDFTKFDSGALLTLEFWAIRPGEDTGKVYIKVTDLNCANIMAEKVRAQRLYGYHRFPVEINYSNDLGSIKIPAKLSPGS